LNTKTLKKLKKLNSKYKEGERKR